ncbi:MAG: aminotransferase class IV [Bacteroidales bacterium]
MRKERFIESIRVENGVFQNLEYHQKRVDKTSKAFSFNKILDLNSIDLSHIKDNNIYKCRVLYSDDEYSMEIIKYKKREISSLKIVYDDNIEYDFKFENRASLNSLFERRQGCSDILIVKDGFITDTSYSNIVLFDGEEYFTPKTFLLNGTMRQRLLYENIIKEREIKVDDLKDYKRLFLINALNSLDDNLSVEIENIIL